MRTFGRGRSPALILVACALAAAASTALGATGHGKPAPRKHHVSWTCPRRCSNVIRRLADAEVKRLQSVLFVGRADYAATANIANHVATADQSTLAGHAATADSAPIARVVYVTRTATFAGSDLSLAAPCPNATNVISGGTKVEDPADSSVIDSGPSGRTGWSADAKGITAADGTKFTVTAICAPAAGTTP